MNKYSEIVDMEFESIWETKTHKPTFYAETYRCLECGNHQVINHGEERPDCKRCC